VRFVGATLLASALALVTTSMGCATARSVTTSSDVPVLTVEAQRHRPLHASIDVDALGLAAPHFGADESYIYIDGKSGKTLSFDQVHKRLTAADVVVVGEQHDQAAHHELQRRIVATMAGESPNLVVGMEMLTWPQQESLDKFNAGTLDADGLAREVDWKKSWGFDFEMYKPILDDGHKAGARFRALNAPRDLVKAMRTKGIEGLTAEQKAQLPDLDFDDEEHRAWFQSVFAPGHPSHDAEVEPFYRAQVLWDESMADRTVRALGGGASKVVVIAGIGHVAMGRGIPERIERRRPELNVMTVVPLQVDASDVVEVLKQSISRGDADVLVVPRYEDELAL
jgi:uncharacterized iron-regulated protein